MKNIDLQPTLVGETLHLRPLRDSDFDSLYSAASDPKIWESHPDTERYKREAFQKRFFDTAIQNKGALLIQKKASEQVIGSSRYYDWIPESREIGIGYTFITRNHWGDGTNAELKSLMLDHICQWAKTVWFHVGKENLRSRRAVEKLGARLSHSEKRELDGKPHTQLFYRLESGDIQVAS